MATATLYPKVPAKAWTVLRAKASTAPSTKFTASAVAALLDMANPDSARTNIVSPLRKLGLIEEEGALTARGNKWRNDATYAEACQEIIDEIYPSELSALTNDSGAPDRSRVMTWLQHTGLGDSNARQMAATYVMIAEKSPPDAASGNDTQPRRREPRSGAKKVAAAAPNRVETADQADREPNGGQGSGRSGPTVHLDIQIHIPAAATAEQIDQIFASMAKHLY